LDGSKDVDGLKACLTGSLNGIDDIQSAAALHGRCGSEETGVHERIYRRLFSRAARAFASSKDGEALLFAFDLTLPFLAGVFGVLAVLARSVTRGISARIQLFQSHFAGTT
jgi:hypothetical protein